MRTLIHAKAHLVSQPAWLSSAPPTPFRTEPLRRSIKRILIAAGLATAVAAPAWSAQLSDAVASQSADGAVDRDSAALHGWRAFMRQNPAQTEGCFHASYPNTIWENVPCRTGQPRVHPAHVKPADGAPEVVGNGHDYVAKAAGLISSATGDFTISGVTSEKSVGVAAFGDGGILGKNEYSVQLNTNDLLTTSACAGHSGCHVWQQFVYATDYTGPGGASVFIQYWLLDWGSSACPGGWGQYESDCYTNSALAAAPDVPITDLGDVVLGASAAAGSTDSATFTYDSDAYSITASDRVLDISSVWNKVEFNVVGDAGGSRARFNNGSSITVTMLLVDGSSTAPTCVANDGTTGETNNLNLGTCKTVIGIFGIPFVEFTESN